MATELGLTNAVKYANKPAVADAINRVNGGEDAAAVNTELGGSPDDTTAAPKATAKPKASEKKIHAVNGGHLTQFDETGNPVYDPNQV